MHICILDYMYLPSEYMQVCKEQPNLVHKYLQYCQLSEHVERYTLRLWIYFRFFHGIDTSIAEIPNFITQALRPFSLLPFVLKTKCVELPHLYTHVMDECMET